jgi:hypothetical protein
MRRKLYPLDVVSRAQRILSAWEQIGPEVRFGIFTQDVFAADMAQADTIEEQIRRAEIELKHLRNERDALYLSLWDKVKRVYSWVRSAYGDDSTEYEMLGRKRASQRKRRSRRVGRTSLGDKPS